MFNRFCLFCLFFTLGNFNAFSEDETTKKKDKCDEEIKKICEASASSKDECLSKNLGKLSHECREKEVKKMVDTNSNDCVTQVQQACAGRDINCLKDLGTQVSDKCAAMVKRGHPDNFLGNKMTKTLQKACAKTFEDKCSSKVYGKFSDAGEANREMLKCIKEVTSKKAYGKECEQTMNNLAKDFNENKDLYKTIED